MQDLITGFITVRTSSSRLPNKCLLPFGDCNVIEHIIRRTIAYGIDPIVCTSIDPSDDVIEDIARTEGVKFFRGSLRNKLKRWSDCSVKFGVDSFHTIDADDLFFDGDEIKKSMSLLSSTSFDMVCPSKVSSSGGGSVGYSLRSNLVHRATIGIDVDADTEMMWFYLEKLPEVKRLVLEDSSLTPKQLRLTLDYLEDYWLLDSVRRMVGNLAGRSVIDELFISNPDLHKVNWFRNTEWQQAQLAKNQSNKN